MLMYFNVKRRCFAWHLSRDAHLDSEFLESRPSYSPNWLGKLLSQSLNRHKAKGSSFPKSHLAKPCPIRCCSASVTEESCQPRIAKKTHSVDQAGAHSFRYERVFAIQSGTRRSATTLRP